jgi:hypothetical protein
MTLINDDYLAEILGGTLLLRSGKLTPAELADEVPARLRNPSG